MIRSVMFLLLLIAGPVQAQTYTVAAFPSSTTNPNATTPIKAVSYTVGSSITCNQPTVAQSANLTNPTEGRVAEVGGDCVFSLSPLVATLPNSTYKGAIKKGTGPYGVVTSSFTMAQGAGHPCDVTPPTAATIGVGAHTFSVCMPDQDVNGNVATPTGWALYVDTTVKTTPTGVVAGTTVNAPGKRLYSIPVTVTSGTHTFQAAAVNASGESGKSVNLTVTGTLPAGVMVTPTAQGIQ